ncbi:aminotransferase class V-fold PLP-dependent enzyme [Nocardia sp. NPDC046473]|uniref:aminotransferase class V-fold PLP-dependent enzyme n=1 Tax=Nocardia sp. NPDC046473 TaxID=3155733 RepID=UPI0033D07A5D
MSSTPDRTSGTALRSSKSADMRATIPYIDDFVHMNSAAGSLADQSVLTAITTHLELEARTGNTEARLAIAADLETLYSGLAQLTNVPARRISLADSHTSAWQKAFQAVPLGAGDRILVSETEWGGNLSAIWWRSRAVGAVVDIVAADSAGAIDPAALSAMLDERVRMVCLTLAPAINGLVNPIGPIAEVLAAHPAWLFVDASQAFANVVTDLSDPRIDVATVSARKYLRAPRGTGFATYSERFLDQICPIGLDQTSGPWRGDQPVPISGARKFEFMETSFAVRMGMKAAVDVALGRDLAQDMARIAELAGHARSALAELPEVTVEDRSEELSGIVTFSHARLAPSRIQSELRRQKINVAAPQEPYAPLWIRAGRPPTTRISPHAFNTHAEIETAVAAVAAL